ncbi:7-cyano-7-deazaguanine synthase [Lasius niger]|uniref:7-cyano-7-deazaguanine synthase n=1 Tax=Lasius niger TaxID=67767 RepID=A0A0J7NJF6_LASNI|nr:7-cyano-7-deazaguanine synthase [Lasius niger]
MSVSTPQNAALVLFSGGQDSAICLADALSKFSHVETVGFYYGQRHEIELECRKNIRKKLPLLKPEWADKLGEDHLLDLTALGEISETSLTRETEIKLNKQGLPSSFVPGRNIIFLTFSAALATRRNISNLIAGICQTDYSGYPDCRDDFFKSMQVTLNLGMAENFRLHAPLMWINKAQSWELAEKTGGKELVDFINEESHSCYLGERGKRHEWGYGCGTCPACALRAQGWQEYQGKQL